MQQTKLWRNSNLVWLYGVNWVAISNSTLDKHKLLIVRNSNFLNSTYFELYMTQTQKLDLFD